MNESPHWTPTGRRALAEEALTALQAIAALLAFEYGHYIVGGLFTFLAVNSAIGAVGFGIRAVRERKEQTK